MAQENVKKFMDKFMADEALREQLKGKDAAEVTAIAGSLGFEFTEEELKDFSKNIRNFQELTPDQMEDVAGGYIVDRGFWHDYWVVRGWTGDIIDTSFFKSQAETICENANEYPIYITEAQYNEWMEQKKQGKGPFATWDNFKKKMKQ